MKQGDRFREVEERREGEDKGAGVWERGEYLKEELVRDAEVKEVRSSNGLGVLVVAG